jgi:pimeloyl-ACP methyl ester carboxylesterase
MAAAAAPPAGAWREWGGQGPLLVFGHGNGFPPETYRVLLEGLRADFRVATNAARPLWPGSDPRSIGGWYELADDLRRRLVDQDQSGVIGAGHSLGSVLNVLAAAADPNLFRALVLIDPVVFTGTYALFWGAFKCLGLGDRLPLIRGARRRRDRFPSRKAALASYRDKPVFSSWLPEVLQDYVEAGFADAGDGSVQLSYPKAWEARIFETTPASVWRELHRVETPMLIIRGGNSDTFRLEAARRARRELPGATVVELAGAGHFVPMERPRDVAARIVEWWRRLDPGGVR